MSPEGPRVRPLSTGEALLFTGYVVSCTAVVVLSPWGLLSVAMAVLGFIGHLELSGLASSRTE